MITIDDVMYEWIEKQTTYVCPFCGGAVKDEIIYMLIPYQLPKYCPYCGESMDIFTRL